MYCIHSDLSIVGICRTFTAARIDISEDRFCSLKVEQLIPGRVSLHHVLLVSPQDAPFPREINLFPVMPAAKLLTGQNNKKGNKNPSTSPLGKEKMS